MTKGVDIVGILKWATETQKTMNTEKPKRRNYREYRNENPMDKLFNSFLEDQLRTKFKEMDEKLNKKEEKKEEKTWWQSQPLANKFAILTLTVPPAIMAEILIVLSFVKVIKHF